MAMKDSPESKNGAQPDEAAEVRRLRAQVEALQAANAAKEAELEAERAANAEMASIMPDQPLPEHLQPVYEVAGPGHFFSPDCVLYPPGSVIRDLYGNLPLNTEMIALNEPAGERLDAYLASLPGQGALSHDLIIEAAMNLRPKEGEDPVAAAAYHGKLLEQAMLLKAKQEGRLPAGPGEKLQPHRPKRPTRPSADIPIMTNSRIRHLSNPGDLYASRVDPGRLPDRQVYTERVR